MMEFPDADRVIVQESSLMAQVARWGNGVILALSVLYLLSFTFIALFRMSYPYELEWLEGEMVDHVGRVLHGLSLYVPPSLDFVPAIYTPLYFYVAAGISWLTGPGFLPLRLLSLVSTLGCLALIFQFVRRETSDRVSAIIATGLFAAMYYRTGTFYDLARIDSFALVSLLGGAVLLYGAVTPRRLVGTAIVFSIAFFTKQTALPVIALMCGYAIWQNHTRSLWLIGPLLAVTGAGIAIGNMITGGWFSYYVFVLPGRPELNGPALADFFLRDLLKWVPVLVFGTLGTLYILIRSHNKRLFWFVLLLVAGFGAVSLVARMHIGGHVNVLMPIYAALAIGTGLLVSYRKDFGNHFGQHVGLVRLVVILAILGQMVRVWYNPIDQIPSREMTTAGRRFVAALAGPPGELYLPYHGYLSAMSGKQAMSHIQPVIDLGLGDSAQGRLLNAELERSFATQRFSLVVLDQKWKSPALDSNYRLFPNPLGDSAMYHPWSEGDKYRPRYWYIPRRGDN